MELTDMAVFGVDYAWGRPGPAALKRAGVRFVCRYLSHDTTGKNLTRAEAEQLSEAGLWLVVVWETTASRALSGRAGGAADARDADRQARALGMPSGRPIYFAVDFDATAAQQGAVNAYLDGAAGVIGRSRVGLYGGYGPVKRALDAGKAVWAWQTYAWSGGRWDRRAQLRQYSNDHVINGVGVDYDRAVADDYGQWRVGVAPGGDEDVPDYVSVGATTEQPLPPGVWTTVAWDAEYSDATGRHPDRGGADVLSGPARYSLTASVRLRGAPAGTRVQARAIEADPGDAARFDTGAVQDFTSAGDETNVLYGVAADSVGKDRRVRFQVVQYGAVPARITGGSAKLLYWRD
ncbi:glycoside hydrolase domain-containing protein [Spirillospora sp. NPDC127200]